MLPRYIMLPQHMLPQVHYVAPGSNPNFRSDRTAITLSKLYMLKHTCYGCPQYFQANNAIILK